jgi:hypothetical protein
MLTTSVVQHGDGQVEIWNLVMITSAELLNRVVSA